MERNVIEFRIFKQQQKYGTPSLQLLDMPCGLHTSMCDVEAFLRERTCRRDSVPVILAEGYGQVTLDKQFLDVFGTWTLRRFMSTANIVPVRYLKDTHGIHFSVKTLSGQLLRLIASSNTTVLQVKRQIERRIWIPVEEQHLVFNGEKLNDTNTVRECKIRSGDVLSLILSLRGGGKQFLDITNADAKVYRKWSAGAPSWRSVAPGMCLEGRCRTKECRAFQQMVIVNMKMGLFDVLSMTPECPECLEKIEAKTVAFHNCMYRIRAVRTGSLAELKIPWTSIGDHYETWDPKKTGIVSFDVLSVEVRCSNHELTECGSVDIEAEYCAVCLEENNDSSVVLGCQHCFHSTCWKLWESTCVLKYREISCPICRVEVDNQKVRLSCVHKTLESRKNQIEML